MGLLFLVLVAGCRDADVTGWTSAASPAGPNSEAPAFHVGPEGAVYLSWIEWVNDSTSTLRFSVREGNAWTSPSEIARGTDWFVNWADRPGLTAFSDGKHMAAHWLQKSTVGKYDYDVMVALSADGGRTWQEPFVLHDDGVAAEHGFASAVRDGDKLFYCWLDGRKTKKDPGGHGSHGHDHHGAMTLRGAWLDVNGRKYGEAELDSMVCDCCPTAVTATGDGLLVTYRDRSPEEIRDIAQVRWDGRSWSSPEIPLADVWHIPGCPVNGPALAHRGDTVCRAWYGVRDSVAHVSAALSHDGGVTWQVPVRLDENGPVGRVDVSAGEHAFLVTWIGQDEADSTWLLAVSLPPQGQAWEPEKLANIDPGRVSGYPVLAVTGTGWLVAYTSVEANGPQVKLLEQPFD